MFAQQRPYLDEVFNPKLKTPQQSFTTMDVQYKIGEDQSDLEFGLGVAILTNEEAQDRSELFGRVMMSSPKGMDYPASFELGRINKDQVLLQIWVCVPNRGATAANVTQAARLLDQMIESTKGVWHSKGK